MYPSRSAELHCVELGIMVSLSVSMSLWVQEEIANSPPQQPTLTLNWIMQAVMFTGILFTFSRICALFMLGASYALPSALLHFGGGLREIFALAVPPSSQLQALISSSSIFTSSSSLWLMPQLPGACSCLISFFSVSPSMLQPRYIFQLPGIVP